MGVVENESTLLFWLRAMMHIVGDYAEQKHPFE